MHRKCRHAIALRLGSLEIACPFVGTAAAAPARARSAGHPTWRSVVEEDRGPITLQLVPVHTWRLAERAPSPEGERASIAARRIGSSCFGMLVRSEAISSATPSVMRRADRQEMRVALQE